MIIKSIDDKTEAFKTLKALLPYANKPQKKRLLHELSALQKGYYNEKQVAYLLDHAFGDKQNTLVLHDLRLEYNDQVAQIDHLLINAGAIYILESKYFSRKLHIDIYGNWIAKYDHAEYAIPSPIEQNRRHISLLKKILEAYDLIPSRLGIKVSLNFFDFVLVSTNCILEGEIPPNVIKADTIETTLHQKWDTECDRYFWLNSFKLAANLITHNEMSRIAKTLLSLHQPLTIDYAAKYGIQTKLPVDTTLLNKLKNLRTTLAQKEQIFPYMIFRDHTLEELARYKPQNPKQIKKIKGIGEIKYAKYGYKFLNLILEHQKESKTKEEAMTS